MAPHLPPNSPLTSYTTLRYYCNSHSASPCVGSENRNFVHIHREDSPAALKELSRRLSAPDPKNPPGCWLSSPASSIWPVSIGTGGQRYSSLIERVDSPISRGHIEYIIFSSSNINKIIMPSPLTIYWHKS